MKRFSICVALMSMIIAGPACADGFIMGQISATEYSYPVPDADIWIFDAITADLVDQTLTDESGYFASAALAAGNYKIRVKGTILKGGECVLFVREFLGTGIGDGKAFHNDVFDDAAVFSVFDGSTTQIAHTVAGLNCPDPIQCIIRTAGVAGGVLDGSDEGLTLDGILVQGKNAINAMPVFELVTGAEGLQSGEFYWRHNVCVFSEVKLRFVDPAGEFSSEYFPDQPDDFSLGEPLDLIPPIKIATVILDRVSLPDQIANIAVDVELLPIGDNALNSLAHSLAQASGKLTDDNPNNDKATCGILKGFVNQLNGLVSRSELSAEDQESLTSSVQAVRDGLGCQN